MGPAATIITETQRTLLNTMLSVAEKHSMDEATFETEVLYKIIPANSIFI